MDKTAFALGRSPSDGAVAAEANPDRHDTVCSSSALSNLLARYPARKQARLVATSPSASRVRGLTVNFLAQLSAKRGGPYSLAACRPRQPAPAPRPFELMARACCTHLPESTSLPWASHHVVMHLILARARRPSHRQSGLSAPHSSNSHEARPPSVRLSPRQSVEGDLDLFRDDKCWSSSTRRPISLPSKLTQSSRPAPLFRSRLGGREENAAVRMICLNGRRCDAMSGSSSESDC